MQWKTRQFGLKTLKKTLSTSNANRLRMGNPISTVRTTLAANLEHQKEEKQAKEEQLHLLERMIQGRLEDEKNNILNGEKRDQEIDSGTIVALDQQIRIIDSSKPQGAEDAIGDFFSGEELGGIKALLDTAINTVLGNSSIGEYETKQMFIVWSDNALIRCDIYFYRWTFTSKSVVTMAEAVSGILLVKRVVDLTKTDPQVLTYAITSQAKQTGLSTNKEINTMIQSAMKTIKEVVGLQASVRQIEAGNPEADKD